MRDAYCITYSADTVPFRICYCLTEVLCDRSDYVKTSVLWRHVWCDIIGFYQAYWDPYKMSVTNHPSSVIEKYSYSTTYVCTKAVVHLTISLTQDGANGCKSHWSPVWQYDRSDHVKTLLQWTHVLCDFSGFCYLDLYVKNLTDKTSQVLQLRSATVHCPNVVAWHYTVHCFIYVQGCSHHTRPPPPNNTRGQRQQIYVLSYHMPSKRTRYNFCDLLPLHKAIARGMKLITLTKSQLQQTRSTAACQV